jgi:hypothetical protein
LRARAPEWPAASNGTGWRQPKPNSDQRQLELVIADLLPGATIELRTLCGLLSSQVPPDDDVRAILIQAAALVKASHPALEFVATPRSLRTAEQSIALFEALLGVLEKAANAADAGPVEAST